MSDVAKKFFEQAAIEVSEGSLDQALYIKAMALSDGDEGKGRALYIRLRAEELQSEYRKQYRLDKTARVIGGAAGLAVGTAKVAADAAERARLPVIICAIFSFFIPGSGHLICGRGGAAFIFFFSWIAIWFLGATVFQPIIYLILIPSIWSIFDVIKNYPAQN